MTNLIGEMPGFLILSERFPAFSGGAGGGMPDLASIQQQMQQNPEVMSQMLSVMNSPDFLRTMRIQSSYASGDGIQS